MMLLPLLLLGQAVGRQLESHLETQAVAFQPVGQVAPSELQVMPSEKIRQLWQLACLLATAISRSSQANSIWFWLLLGVSWACHVLFAADLHCRFRRFVPDEQTAITHSNSLTRSAESALDG